MGLLVDAVRSIWLGPFGSGDKALAQIMGSGPPLLSGVSIGESNATTISAFWAGVRIISETVASLPLHLYKRIDENEKERYEDHPLYALLHDEPNSEMSSMTFREM